MFAYEWSEADTARNGHVDVVRYLLTNGANIARHEILDGRTALQDAASNGKVGAVAEFACAWCKSAVRLAMHDELSFVAEVLRKGYDDL